MIKIKTLWNSSEIDAILAWAMKWWMALSVTRVVSALLCSDELYCPLHQSGVAVAGATNAVNTKQSEAVTVSLFFPPAHPTLLTSSPLRTGILYSPQFRSHQETKMAARQTQRSTSTISRKNRGLWTVYCNLNVYTKKVSVSVNNFF